MQNADSVSRIVHYFHALASESFTYRGDVLQPFAELVVSDKVFRSYTCPEGCGACCMRCSLVWDHKPEGVFATPIGVEVNGVTLDWWVDEQKDNTDRFCKHLTVEGRCGIHSKSPLPCKLELWKFVKYTSANRFRALVRLPGRGWNLTRVDGEKGAKCEILPYDKTLTETHIRDLRILWRWMDEFQIANDCERVIDYLRTGPHPTTLKIIRNEASLW